jgi:hypothetical protein
MAALLLYPGDVGEPVSLQAILREAHNASRQGVLDEMAARNKAGVPLDDSTDWRLVGSAAERVSQAIVARDASALSDAARSVVALSSGYVLADPGEYVDSEDLDGVTVTMRMCSDSQRRGWVARRASAWREWRQAIDDEGKRAADERLCVLYEEMITVCIARVDGLQGMRATIADSLPGLRLAGLLVPFHDAVRYFLELPPGKALRCGRLQPST